MIVKLLRPGAEHMRWYIRSRDGKLQRWVARDDLPRRVIEAALEPETFWFASVDAAARLALHDRVPAQEW
jgi:hypothetical protein